ncbi:hypothetical protein [Desulfoluna butyratoxydans]|uniref:Polysaccharide biosynthesis protein n=1 Tax=Desulfoluna butyratoxydans TaxID=231438 RepID=A0A4U8YQK0_9BACT|nr:hypothetical protein [Desulfoluna butyratoxydans]VFQ46555.1 hypothetical protein MSL71_42220 [Desulfoluna butyratoxydans]
MDSKNRIAFNTFVLSLKMVFSIGLALFSTRIVLQALGVSDFGIFNLIAGTIGILSFMNMAMAASVQRHLSFEIGRRDMMSLNRVFSTSVVMHIIIGIVVYFILQVSAVPLFNGVLNIPSQRISSAKFIYQSMAITTLFSIASVPYEAGITAHERMGFIAIVGVIESAFKVVIAVALLFLPFDRLKMYGLFISLLMLCVLFVKWLYCRLNFNETTLCLSSVRLVEFKKMLAFTGWTTMTAFSEVLQGQGLAIVFNYFLGVRVNAAYGIARQVSGQTKYMSAVLNKVASPQTISRVGEGRSDDAIRLAFSISKAGYLLVLIIAIPLWLEMESVFKFWLNDPPEYSVWFCRIILVTPVLRSMTYPFQPLIHASGNIADYQKLLTLVQLLVLPVGAFLLWIKVDAYMTLLTIVFAEIILGAGRLYHANKQCGVNVRVFSVQVLFPSILVFGLSFGTTYWAFTQFQLYPFRIFLTTMIGVTIIALSSWIVLFSDQEKRFVLSAISRLFCKINLRVDF